MISNGSSERHQNNNLKAIISYANYQGPTVILSSINTSQEVLSFLDTKIKTKEEVLTKNRKKCFQSDCYGENPILVL